MNRLLLVDDEPIIAEGLANLLREEISGELEIYSCFSAKEALSFLDEMRADLVVTDIKMPEMDGIQLFEEIRWRWDSCRVIFLTGYEDFAPLYQASKYRDVRYLLKSEGPDAVLQAVKEVLSEIEEAQSQRATHGIPENAMEILRIGMVRSVLDGQLPLSQGKLLAQTGELSMQIQPERPFFLLIGSIGGELSSYISFLNCFFQLRELAERLFHNFCAFIQVYDDWTKVIWILQSDRPDYLCKHLPGTLELLQQEAEKQLKLQIGFLFSQTTTDYLHCPAALSQMRRILAQSHGLYGKILLVNGARPVTGEPQQ